MSSLSSSDIQLIEILTSTSNQLNRYLSLFIFFFGIIGNILNIIILSQRTLRSNPCIFLFLISSISNLISILFGLTPRIMSGWYGDLTHTNRYYCKLCAFIVVTSRTIAFWLIMLATIDRWILSLNNAQRRQLSTLKNAQRGSVFIIILSILIYLHILYCYESNLLDTPSKCYGKTVSCRFLTDIIYACCSISLPFILMIIFGLITISNIHHTHSYTSWSLNLIKYNKKNDVSIFINEQKKRWKKIDRYLRGMLFLQVILLICLTLPQTIHKLYSTLTLYEQKSEVRDNIDRFLYKFGSLLPYVANGMPFYIYTLTGGKIFRNTLKKMISHNG
jgi:hypothetical protein